MDLTAKQFEQLLCEFCKQDIPPNFTVEHDSYDIGEESGNQRQIDVRIKGRLGVSDILICGEAKNWTKAVGSETIDGLVGKYLSSEIRANKIILFSNQGYFDPAIKRGKTLGIEMLEPFELGKPICKIPHIIGVGCLDQIVMNFTNDSFQQTVFPTDLNDLIIIKGNEKISLRQNVKRLLVKTLRDIKDKTIYSDLTKFTFNDENVLYESKRQIGYRYDGNFKIEVTIKWDYFFEFLETGILNHLNTGEIILVNLQGNSFEISKKVLLSPTKGNYEQRDDCIINIVDKYITQTLLCISDPDRNATNPYVTIIEFV